MKERGHSLESIQASIEARKPDFDAYIGNFLRPTLRTHFLVILLQDYRSFSEPTLKKSCLKYTFKTILVKKPTRSNTFTTIWAIHELGKASFFCKQQLTLI